MFVAGIWALASGKLPSILFGGPKCKFEGRGVRLLGLILILPLHLVFVSSFLLAHIIGDQANEYVGMIEFVIVIVSGISALIFSRFVREPAVPASDYENGSDELSQIELTIAKKAQGSLIYALLGIFGITTIVVCPLAFIRANQALNLIAEYKVGEHYRSTAKAARIIAPIIFLVYVCVFSIFLVIGTRGL